MVERCLRVHDPSLSGICEVFRNSSLWVEALVLETPGLLEWAEQQIIAGLILTAADETYPKSWIEKLGPSAPPSLWISGNVPSAPFLAVVGGRHVDREATAFARACGCEGVRLGYSIVSGGAAGCDRAAVAGTGAAHSLEILPYGFDVARRAPRSPCRVSVCAPNEAFSTGTAMERNTLIYSLADAAVIAHARFKAGGTWHGALDAHRRRLTRLIVRKDDLNPAHRALIGLGAGAVERPEELSGMLSDNCGGCGGQPRLVG